MQHISYILHAKYFLDTFCASNTRTQVSPYSSINSPASILFQSSQQTKNTKQMVGYVRPDYYCLYLACYSCYNTFGALITRPLVFPLSPSNSMHTLLTTHMSVLKLLTKRLTNGPRVTWSMTYDVSRLRMTPNSFF